MGKPSTHLSRAFEPASCYRTLIQDYLTVAALCAGRAKSPRQIKNMNPANQNNNILATSVTTAPRNQVRGVINFVAILTTHKHVRACACR
jgi:hypothetical protein